ncbi:MAG: hypothetical protein GX914_04225 [Erysipelotrichia bacterium]|nr:hypothetical protein [Erysipelotrichia bacterium]
MKNKKKFITLLAIIAIALGIVFAIKKFSTPVEKQQGSKQITIIVQNLEEKEVFNKTFATDAEYLDKLLEEHAEELQLDISEVGEYGRSVNGLCGLVTEDWNTGPWWVYESENSECCKASGFCPSVDTCVILDGEIYIFKFISY